MYTKKNARVTFKSNRKIGFKRSNNFSNGKPRNKGNLSQQYNKYLKLAKDAFTSGDRIQSEYYYQYTDHFYRLMIEMGINVEENDVSFDAKTRESREIKVKKSEVSENFDLESSNVEKDNNSEDVENEENIESIESIPFIAEPVKKKRTLSKK